MGTVIVSVTLLGRHLFPRLEGSEKRWKGRSGHQYQYQYQYLVSQMVSRRSEVSDGNCACVSCSLGWSSISVFGRE